MSPLERARAQLAQMSLEESCPSESESGADKTL